MRYWLLCVIAGCVFISGCYSAPDPTMTVAKYAAKAAYQKMKESKETK
jgi:hypothetical protein